MDERTKPSRKMQKAVDDAKLAFSAALGLAGFLFIPMDAWGACYFFMVGAMAVSTLASMSTALREGETAFSVAAASEDMGKGDSADSFDRAHAASWPFAAF